MRGQLIQINNIDGESIGLWYTEEIGITDEMLVDWFRDYDDSDRYEESGISGFDGYVAEIGYKIKRVYINEVNL